MQRMYPSHRVDDSCRFLDITKKSLTPRRVVDYALIDHFLDTHVKGDAGRMFYHLVLGCLRDGKSRHGYEVWVELTTRSGLRINPGNVYRELAKLVSQKLIDAVEKSSHGDARRNPYAITDAGRRAFDEWLTASSTQDNELAAWIGFIDRVPPSGLPGIVDRLQERLWLKAKTLAHAREDALARARANGHRAVSELSALQSLLEMKQATAALEFVEELRRMLGPAAAKSAEPPRRARREGPEER